MMGALIRAADWSLEQILAVGVGLRSYRGTSEDQHALLHLTICQAAVSMDGCSDLHGCRADWLLCELERRAHMVVDVPIAGGDA